MPSKKRNIVKKKSAKVNPVDFYQTLREMAYSMVGLKRPERLLKMLTRYIDRDLGTTHAALLFLDKKKDRFTFVDSKGIKRLPVRLIKFDLDHPLIKWFSRRSTNSKSKDYIYRPDLRLSSKSKSESHEQVARTMDDLKVELVIPGYYKKKIFGMLFLGSKRNRRCFTDSEISFLQILAQDCSMAFKNAEYQKDLMLKNEELEKQLNQIQKFRAKEKKNFYEILSSLAQEVYAKDAYTFGHVKQVERLGLMTAKEMGYDLSGRRKDILSASLILHDLGKVGIPDHILNKPARLDSEEWKVMQTHVEKGAKILEHLTEFKEVANIVWCHHESFDGTGYPRGIKGDLIPLESRIVSVVDAFHAIVSTRCYSKGQPVEYAFCELRRCAGTQFDPDVVEALIATMKKEMKKRGGSSLQEAEKSTAKEAQVAFLS